MNEMSGEKKGLQLHICHVSPYALYMNCQNHRLALCLVHLLKHYNELESVDALLMSFWKIFHYSSIRQAVFENAQETENMMLSKILKSCATQWLTQSKTSIRVITQLKALVAALDAIYQDKKYQEAKGICNILLTPDIILMLLLLAEVLLPINNFCKFLQTRNLNYSLVMAKYQQVVSKLESIKNELPNHSSIDTNQNYFQFSRVNIFSTLKNKPSMEKLVSSLEVWVCKWSPILLLKSQTWWSKRHQCCQHSICSTQTQSRKITITFSDHYRQPKLIVMRITKLQQFLS